MCIATSRRGQMIGTLQDRRICPDAANRLIIIYGCFFRLFTPLCTPMSNNGQSNESGLTDEEKGSSYFLRSRQQIVSALHELCNKSTNINAYYRAGQRNILTSIVAVIPDKGLVTLETVNDQRKHLEVLQEGSLFCVGRVGNIPVKFHLNGIKEVLFHGETVFVSPLPDGIYRPQRREFFRVVTPMLKPVLCSFTREGVGTQSLVVANISVGGVCLIDSDTDRQYLLREKLTDAVLELAGFGTLETTLEIQNLLRTTRRNGRKAIRIGCCFIGLSTGDSTLIQRYLHKLQMEQFTQ